MKRWLAVAIAAVLVGLFSTPGMSAAKRDERVVHEAVVTQLNPDGSPDSTLVSQLVQLSSKDGGLVELKMPKVAELTSYRNLSGFKQASGDGKNIVWKTTGSVDAQTLARVNKKLPFQVHVRYFVNGREMKPDEVVGENGRLKMEIELINASGDPKTLTYKALTSPYLTSSVNQYTPFEYAVRVTFPDHEWTGIDGDRFDVAPIGIDQVASATGVLSPPLTGTSETIDVSAHSEDIQRPEVQIYAFPKINPNLQASLETQYEALKALYDGTGEISKNLGKLYDGTIQLVDGLEQFAGGTGQLNDGVGKIVEGVGTRDPNTGKPNITLDSTGTPTTVMGAIGSISEAIETAMLPGIGARDPKTGKAIVTTDSSGTPTTLLGGIGSIVDVIRGTILPAIGTRDPVTGEGVIVKDEFGNTTTLLGGLQSQKDAYDDSLIPGAEQIACGLNNTAFPKNYCGKQYQITQSIASGLNDLNGGVSAVDGGIVQLIAKLQTNSTNPDQFGFVEGLNAIKAGLEQAITGLRSGNPADPGVQEGLLGVSTGLAQILLGLGAYGGAIPAVTTSLQTISTGLTGVVSRLDGADVRTSLETVHTGVVALATSVANVKTSVTDARQAAIDALLLPAVTGDLTGTIAPKLTQIQTDADAALAELGDTGNLTSILGRVDAAKTDLETVLDNLGTSGGTPADIIPTVQTLIGSLTAVVGTLSAIPPPAALIAGVTAAKAGVDAILGGVEGGVVRLATVAALPAYTRVANVITANANGTMAKVDNTSVVAGDLVLLKNGASGADNGVYQVTSIGSSAAPFVLTRPADFDSTSEYTSGMTFSVTAGGTLAHTNWTLTTPNPITLNTTALTFAQATDPSFIGGAKLLLGGVQGLIAGLGTTASFGPGTVIGGLNFMHSIMGQLAGGITTGLLPGVAQLSAGIHNAAWDKPSAKIGGLTPHQYYKQCPGCFDPSSKIFDKRTIGPEFQPGILEAFHLFSDGIHDALPKLVSLDEKNPGLVDGLGLIADGLDTIAGKIQTFDAKNPGLVDGLQLIVDGLEKLAQNLQTFDPNHPGLVDGLQLVEGGVKQLDDGAGLLHAGGQQISQGVFAINELGLRTVHGQVGDTGDKVKESEATIAGAIEDLSHTSTLAKADDVATTYAFEIPATSTAMRDNLIRGGLLALLVALLGLLARRPKLGP